MPHPPGSRTALEPSLPAEAQALRDRLSTWQTIDRRQVHKAAVAEVLLTDGVFPEVGNGVVAAQWPRAHPRYSLAPGSPGYTLLVVETVRQAGLFQAHDGLGVPFSDQFIFQRLVVHHGVSATGLGATPPALTVVLRTTPRFRHDAVTGGSMHAEVWRDDEWLASAEATYACVSTVLYARLRARGLARAAAPATAGTPFAAAEPPEQLAGVRVRPVTVDSTDPTFFDHPADHLPGTLLMDAALQAAWADTADVPGRRLAGLDIRYRNFVERSPAAVVETRPAREEAGRLRVPIAILQGGAAAAEGEILVTRA